MPGPSFCPYSPECVECGFCEVRHTKQHPSNIKDMATWPTDMPCSCLDTYDARENALASRGGC